MTAWCLSDGHWEPVSGAGLSVILTATSWECAGNPVLGAECRRCAGTPSLWVSCAHCSVGMADLGQRNAPVQHCVSTPGLAQGWPSCATCGFPQEGCVGVTGMLVALLGHSGCCRFPGLAKGSNYGNSKGWVESQGTWEAGVNSSPRKPGASSSPADTSLLLK